MPFECSRREFVARTALGTAALCLTGRSFAQGKPESRVIVVKGKDVERMLAKGLEKLGGLKSFFKPGAKVVIKPNAAWAGTPEMGSNTTPALFASCITACRKAGAAKVLSPENPCSKPKEAFGMSALEEAAAKAGGRLFLPKEYKPAAIPQGKRLTEAMFPTDILENDCLINMPVAKSHGGATLTLSMKNWMGSVKDRGFWHRNDLHQCIADCSTRIKPSFVIIDAMRIMLTGGPRGPGKLVYPGQLVFATDFVAADAYAATLFDRDPMSIRHIKLADEAGIGRGDPAGWRADVVDVT